MQTEENLENEMLRAALGSVIRRHGGKWLRFILAILKNEADAEDVMQEAVRRVLARDLCFGSEDDIRMYLGRAIGNAALELYNRRKRERQRQLPINENSMLPARSFFPLSPFEELDTSTEQERLLRLLDEGLQRLPSKQHEALRLTILEAQGLSIRDVGVTNKIPYSTLRHRTKQGLRSLRKFFQSKMRRAGLRRPKYENRNSTFRIPKGRAS